ncbi:helix-turn-helix domain-containing protein [Virgibacillus sp. C22-A2]|uniref:Helix-turn-helix domain-containing protein n=1 Tax=Virgibacillus tibetensis TaxID=3042313 RepID=A0ABU6KDX6_9BACI|nr:helix-turn-helix domain-containing protein [Virgibacillus sp. C22-A2]
MNNNIGNIIKLKRKEKGLTQEELSQEICTPSYLSRIENNQVVPDESILDLLSKKLGISLTKKDTQDADSDVNRRLEDWHIKLLERKNYQENVYELKNLIDQTNNESNTVKFKIIHCRYLLMKGNIKKTTDILRNLACILKPDYTRNYFLYVSVLMIYHHLKEEYDEAISAGLPLVKKKDLESIASDYEIGMIYYNLALSYSKQHQTERCIHYSNIALSIFKDQYFLDRAIDCQLLLGISFNRLGFWEESKNAFLLSERLVTFLPVESQDHYTGIIQNNIGYSLECQGKYKLAISYYEKSLELKRGSKLNTLINLVRSNYNVNDMIKAKEWLYLALDMVNSDSPKKYSIQLQTYHTIFKKEYTDIEEIIKMQQTCTDFFLNTQNWQLLYEYSTLFATIYEKYNLYKRANSMYKLALKANDNKFSRRR